MAVSCPILAVYEQKRTENGRYSCDFVWRRGRVRLADDSPKIGSWILPNEQCGAGFLNWYERKLFINQDISAGPSIGQHHSQRPIFSVRSPPTVLALDETSLEVIQSVRCPTYLREPVGYAESWLKDYIPNKSSYPPLELRERFHRVGARAKYHDPAGTYARKIYNRLLIHLSYNSSRLEGKHLLQAGNWNAWALKGEATAGKLDEEKVYVILNHMEAIRHPGRPCPRLSPSEETFRTRSITFWQMGLSSEGTQGMYAIMQSGSAAQPTFLWKVQNASRKSFKRSLKKQSSSTILTSKASFCSHTSVISKHSPTSINEPHGSQRTFR